MGFLEETHIQKIFKAFQNFKGVDQFARVLSINELEEGKWNLAISRYIRPDQYNADEVCIATALADWKQSSSELSDSMNELFKTLQGQ